MSHRAPAQLAQAVSRHKRLRTPEPGRDGGVERGGDVVGREAKNDGQEVVEDLVVRAALKRQQKAPARVEPRLD